MSNPLSLSDADEYRIVRGQIEFEANLISQRLSWFVASQSFLFSAYAITLNAPVQSASPGIHDQQNLVYHLIPAVAIASCVLIYAAVIAGFIAQKHLREYLATRIPASRLVDFPAIQGANNSRILGMATPLGLPIVFVAVWLFLFTRGLT